MLDAILGTWIVACVIVFAVATIANGVMQLQTFFLSRGQHAERTLEEMYPDHQFLAVEATKQIQGHTKGGK
jgi:hypothetical protein